MLHSESKWTSQNNIKEEAMRKITPTFLFFLALLAGTFSIAFADIPYTDNFNTRYGTSGGYNYNPVLGSCLTCHPAGSSRNSYANDWRNNGHNFAAVEGMDSDNDGFTNIDEIVAGTFPGNASSKPAAVNNPPVANAGLDQTVDEGVVVTLNGSNSTDPDDGIASYLWTKTGGPAVTLSNTTAVQPTFTAPDVGLNGDTLTFQLRVTDNGGLQSTDITIVNISWVNLSPTANAGPDQTVDEGVNVTLNGSNSSDPDDGIASYFWEQTGGTLIILSDPSVAQPTFTSPLVGGGADSLTFRLTVADGLGLESTDICIVNVSTGNLPPTSNAGVDQTVNVGTTVTLNGSNSSDPDGSITAYLWEQTGGTAVTLSSTTAAQPTFTAPNVGSGGESLTFQLTVTDDVGLKATDAISVNILWSNAPPTANAGPDQTVDEGATVTLNGSNSSDPDDGLASYLWEQTGGTPVTLSDVGASQPTFVAPVVDLNGTTLTFRLTVEDFGGLQATDVVSVIVNDNGIAGFPNDVVTTTTFDGEPFGVKEDNGGSFTRLAAIDPTTIPESLDKPENLILGLVDMEVKVNTPGATTTVTIYLTEPAPEGYTWYKYDTVTEEWTDYSAYAVFNTDRDQVTLTLTDGGIGDDDGVANGIIVDPSGLGTAPPAASALLNSVGGDWGAGGGCFITNATYGSIMESHVNVMSWMTLHVGQVSTLVLMVLVLGAVGGTGVLLFRRKGPREQNC
jgi:hypothetical protein